jgi:hypothetical protein
MEETVAPEGVLVEQARFHHRQLRVKEILADVEQ